MKSEIKYSETKPVSKKRKLSDLCDGPPAKKMKFADGDSGHQEVKDRNEMLSTSRCCDDWFVSYSDGWYPVNIMDLKRMWIEGIVNEYCTIWNPKYPNYLTIQQVPELMNYLMTFPNPQYIHVQFQPFSVITTRCIDVYSR